MEEDWQYYQQQAPGQVQVLGIDCWNGTTSQVQSYLDQTGTTFPVFLNGTTGTGGNLYTPYLDTSNYIVINKQGVIRYHAYDLRPSHTRRYVRAEIRGAIDSLIAPTVGVGDPPPSAGDALRAYPNPSRGAQSIELSHSASGTPARVTVLDLAGRLVATPFDGIAPEGPVRATWDGRTSTGANAPAGVYLVRATLGGRTLTRRIVRMR